MTDSATPTPGIPAERRRRGLQIVWWVLGGLGALIVLGVVGIVIWSQVGVYQAEAAPLAEVRENAAIEIADSSAGIVLSPADGGSEVGLVFIPGAKVDPWAYADKLSSTVEAGVTVVITRPWLNLAFFDLRPLSAFTELAPDVETWIVGGHSLGGVRACQLSADADALALFASYCAADISASGLPVLSIAGSEDGLSTPEKVADARPLLPGDAEMEELAGASHSSFGDYGPQDGDGTPSISDDDMRAALGELVSEFAVRLEAAE